MSDNNSINFVIALAQAVSNNDDSLRASFLTNASSTVFLAFTLMDLQAAWQPVLDNDINQGVAASVTPGGPAWAAYWQLQYETDTEGKNAQSDIWEGLVRTNQTDIDADSDARQGNFTLVEGLGSMCATTNNLLVRVNR